ncbi:Cell morphogenesis protein PAG1, partial [Dispira parvispora]
ILPEPFINAPYPQSTQSLTPPSGPSLPLLEIAQSSRYSHRMLWSAYLTWVVHKVYDIVPQVTLYTRARVCSHFHQLYSLIVHYSDVPSPIPALSYISGRLAGKSDTVDLELVEQWRNFLGFISATLLRNLDSELLRYRISDVLSDKNMMNINNTSELVKLLKPLFYCENPMIRQAVVHGLGCIHESSYADLIKALHPQMKEVYQVTMLKSSHKSYSTLKRDQKVDRLRGVLVHILRLTARHLSCTRYLEDERLLDYQTAFVDEIGTFLQDAGIQNTWDYQNLRIQFCGLVDVLFYYVSLLPHSTTMFPFKYRHTFFNMFEDWCGFGEHSERTRLREAEMMTNVLEKYVDVLERGTVTSMMEEERTALEGAALRAMATLCRGTISATEDDAKSISGNSPLPQFDISKLFRWIETIFASADRRVHGIARHSLEWLLEFNRAYPQVLEAIIYRCYARDPADKATHGYFFALHKVITTNPHYPYDCHGMLVLALLKMGDMDPGIRRSAFHLVQSLERRFFRDRCYEAFVSAALSPLATLYRHALLGLSATMSERHPHLTNSFIFEVCSRLELVTEPQQRGMLRFLRPWFCNLQLRYCPVTKRLRDPEHCYLIHLFYLTLTLSKKHLGELEQLWSALVYGDNTRNCDMVVGFLIHAVLTRRNPALLEFVKKVVIFLARTNVSTHLVNTIMSYVTPTLMTPSLQMPWLGDIVATDMSDQDKASLEGGHTSACPGQEMFNEQFPVYSEGPLLSPGQIALIMLVELPSEMGWLLRPYLPDLLHPLVLHVDHLYPRVSEFLATLLANFTRYVVLDHHDPLESVDFLLAQVDVDYIRQREGKLSLTDLHRLVYSLSDLFAVTVGLTPNEMRHRWAQVALMWGTRCAVLIMATTSFRIFNVFIPKVSLGMCLEMVSRLSNVMADDTPEVNQFTACILAIFTKALRQIPHDTTEYHASALLALDNGLLDQAFDPQRTRDALIPFLFWVATVCLVSHLEAEYEQGLTMLEPILQNPLWRFPSLHHTEHLLHDKPLHLQAQMGYPIATLAAQRSSSTSLDRVNPADALPEPTPPWSLRDAIRYYYPEKWKQSFPGIFWLLIRGFRFAHQRALCQRMLIQLIPIAADSLVGIQDVAAVLLLVMDFPLLCQAIQQEYTDSEEAELYVEMVAVIVPDVVTGSETARRALLNVCKKFKAHEYYGVKQFIKDIVQLAGNHFPKHTMDMLFLFLFQLPDTPLAHQEMLLQAMEMLVDQYRSYVTGLFDRDDTLAMVNILLSLMASPSLEPKVTNILESLVLRSGNHIAPIFAQQLQPPRPYSNDKATTWHITLPPAGATRAGSRIDAVTTFSWYGFNSKVSREKIRSLLDFLLQGIATHLRSDTPFSDTNPDNTPSPYLDGSSGSISDPSPMSYPESRINSPVPYFGSPLASVAYESSLFSDDSVDAHLPLSEPARSSSVSAGGFQPRITSADDATPSDLVDMTTLDKIIPQLQDLGDFFSTDSTTCT